MGMVPANDSSLYFAIDNIVRDLGEALWREDAGNLVHLASPGYDLVYPKRAVL